MNQKYGIDDKEEQMLYKRQVQPVGTFLTASKTIKNMEISPFSKKTPEDLSSVPLINKIKYIFYFFKTISDFNAKYIKQIIKIEETKNETQKFSNLYENYFSKNQNKNKRLFPNNSIQFTDLINKYNENNYKLSKSIFSKNIFNENPLLMTSQKDINDFFNKQCFMSPQMKRRRLERTNSMKFLSNLNTITRERIQGYDVAPNNDAKMFENKKALKKKALKELKAFKREFKLIRKEIKKNTKDIQDTEDTISKDFPTETKKQVLNLNIIKEEKNNKRKANLQKKLKLLPLSQEKKKERKTIKRLTNKTLDSMNISFTGMNSTQFNSPPETKLNFQSKKEKKSPIVHDIKELPSSNHLQKSNSSLVIRTKNKFPRSKFYEKKRKTNPIQIEQVYNTLKNINISPKTKNKEKVSRINKVIQSFYSSRNFDTTLNKYTKEGYYNTLNGLKFKVQCTNVPNFVNKMHLSNPPVQIEKQIKKEKRLDDQIITFHQSFVQCLMDPFL